MWNSVDPIVCRASWPSSVKMLNFLPTFRFDMVDNSFSGLVDTDSNNSNFVSPSLSMVLKHFLVMSHWSLARWTPSCPEIDYHYLTTFVLKSLFFICVGINNTFDQNVWITSTQFAFNLDYCCSLYYSLECSFIDFFLKSFESFCLILFYVAFND